MLKLSIIMLIVKKDLIEKTKSKYDSSDTVASYSLPAFTVIELLITVIVIAILAVIIFIVYPNLTKSALQSTMNSSLADSYRAINAFEATNQNYPSTISCDPSLNATGSTTNLCLRPTNNFTYSYQVDNTSSPKSFALYVISQDNSIILRTTNYQQTPTKVSLVCPINFIVVPGSNTYGTSDFCISKYDAKQYDTSLDPYSLYSTTNLNYPISKAGNKPWSFLSQSNAVINSTHTLSSAQNSTGTGVTECTSCHLITEAEWMTIAQNVLSQPQNWSGGSVGSGYIYRGHSDGGPSGPLSATDNDSDGYNGTENFKGDMSIYGGTNGDSQKRTLSLSNGEMIWDLSGNVRQWTQGQSTPPQLGIAGGGNAKREWKDITTNNLLVNPLPNGTGIKDAGVWTTDNGIGDVSSNADTTTVSLFQRGGYWSMGNSSGVLALIITSFHGLMTGFRITSTGV